MEFPLKAQRASVTAYAARLGLSLTDVFVDAGTSHDLAIEDRPVLLDAVAALNGAMSCWSPGVTG
jgi:hypothetical protein